MQASIRQTSWRKSRLTSQFNTGRLYGNAFGVTFAFEAMREPMHEESEAS